MFFASDNGGPVPAAVLDALSRANEGFAMAYGADAVTDAAVAGIRDLFDAPDAAVHFVATGTAANSLALATLVQPYDAVFCAARAHIQEDECNAPEFFTGGAKLILVGDGDRMTPEQLRTAIEAEGNRGVHGPQRGAVSLTQVTELGQVYTTTEVTALCDLARSYGLPVHLDGARLANALVATGATPAEMTWKAGVDVVCFGGTKNGLLGAEAVVFFDASRAREFELRRKRGGHLFSKHRYLAAQMEAYVKDDLWRHLAEAANARCARLAEGLQNAAGISIRNRVDANIIFFDAPRAVHRRLLKAGAQYHVMRGTPEGDDPEALLTGRLVCDWSIDEAEIDVFLNIVTG